VHRSTKHTCTVRLTNPLLNRDSYHIGDAINSTRLFRIKTEALALQRRISSWYRGMYRAKTGTEATTLSVKMLQNYYKEKQSLDNVNLNWRLRYAHAD